MAWKDGEERNRIMQEKITNDAGRDDRDRIMQDEIIRYEGIGMAYNSKKVLSGFDLKIKKESFPRALALGHFG